MRGAAVTLRGRNAGKSWNFPDSFHDHFASPIRKIRKSPFRGFPTFRLGASGFSTLVDRINAAGRLVEKSASEAQRLSQALMARLFEPG